MIQKYEANLITETPLYDDVDFVAVAYWRHPKHQGQLQLYDKDGAVLQTQSVRAYKGERALATLNEGDIAFLGDPNLSSGAPLDAFLAQEGQQHSVVDTGDLTEKAELEGGVTLNDLDWLNQYM